MHGTRRGKHAVPLLPRNFEQNLHVRHRPERYHAGRATDYAHATPETIGAAIADALHSTGEADEVERNGAKRAGRLIAQLLEPTRRRTPPRMARKPGTVSARAA